MDADDFKRAHQQLLDIAYGKIKPYLDRFAYVEGNILTSPEYVPKIFNLYKATQQLSHDTPSVLEIGFNTGFSTIIMLLANDRVHVTAVDICCHPYVEWCVALVKEMFPGRFTLIAGDSKAVLPTLPKQQFDLVHIDGDHSPEGARSDVSHVCALGKKDMVVILDDTDIAHIGQLWEHVLSESTIEDIGDCSVFVPTRYHAIGRMK